MSRSGARVSDFEKKCIVSNSLLRQQHGRTADIEALHASVRGDYHLDTLAMRSTPIQSQADIEEMLQQQQALIYIYNNLNQDPSPGFLSRFKLTELVDELPKQVAEQKKVWLEGCNPDYRKQLSAMYDDTIYVTQSAVGRSIDTVYRQPWQLDTSGEDQIEVVIKDLVSIIHYLRHMHMHGLVHTNLQPKNITVSSNQQIKITQLQDTERHYTVIDAPIKRLQSVTVLSQFSPPEVLLGQEDCYLLLADVWMIGMMAYFMATRGDTPFRLNQEAWSDPAKRINAIKKLYEDNRLRPIPINFNYEIFHSIRGQRLKSFIEKCLDPNPMVRRLCLVRKMFDDRLFASEPKLQQWRDACDIDRDLHAAAHGCQYTTAEVRGMTMNAARRYIADHSRYNYRRARLAARPTKWNAIRSMSNVHRVAVVAAVVVAVAGAVTVCVLAPPLLFIAVVSAASAVLVTGSTVATGVVVRKRYKKAKRALSNLYQPAKSIDDQLKDVNESKPTVSDVVNTGYCRPNRLSAKVSFTGCVPQDTGYDTVELSDSESCESKCCMK
ncbi:MAG: protein kinase [Coxiellaceae bacterium]|nr:protein kinase [Coxiellaceae bacterium]